jgi:hypothetical protein
VKKYRVWMIVGVTLLILAVLVVWASSQTPMISRASEEWSRGQVIGQTPVKRQAALWAAQDGSLFLIWQNMGGELELAHIGADGQVLQDRVLSVGGDEAGDPRLQVGADGRLHLLWREGKYPHSTVRYALLNADGAPVSQPHTLSDPDNPVLDAPCLVADAEGRPHVIWADAAGIQWMVLSAEGTPLTEPISLSAAGRSPAVQMDQQGHLHLVWQQEVRAHVESLCYAVLDAKAGRIVSGPETIAQMVLRTGQGLGEPVIGLTSEMCYVFWVIQDFRYVASEGEYIVFPLGAPQSGQIEPLRLREGQYPDGLHVLAGAGGSAERQASLLVALSESVPDPEIADVVRSQIAVLALDQDGVQEQVVTASAQASLKPVLVADSRSNLHMAWLESAEFGRYRVVYASTAPQVLENYNALMLWDVLDAVFSNVFKLSTLIVALVAVLIMWGVLPFLGLVLYHLFTSEEVLITARSWGALIIVLGVEVALTFIQPPRLGVEATWAGWRWTAPAIAAAVAAFVVANIARRRKPMHLFAAYFIFTGVDALLQMLIYFLF